MTPSLEAYAWHLTCLWRDVINDVVRPRGVAADASRHVIEIQRVPRPPGDVVIGARRVAAHADWAPQGGRPVGPRQPAAEHVDAADALAHHRVVGAAVVAWAAAIRHERVDRVALLEAEETATRLHG